MRFARFALVGALGFVVDVGILYSLAALGTGWIAGRLGSWLGAASFTWAVNRRFTFAVAVPPSVREWLAFLAANARGGVVNLGAYYAVITRVAAGAAHPVLGVAAGSIAGLLVNFTLSARVVFQGRSVAQP